LIPVNNILYRCVLAGMFIMTLTVLMSVKTYAGVVLGNTRLIYPANSKEVTLSLKNTETSQTFLVQSVIETVRGEKQHNFVVTPPLFVLKPGGENKLRVFLKTLATMPADKETLFWMSIQAVPHSIRQEQGNFVQFSVTNRIKLLYRPNGLALPDESVWQKITFSSRGDDLVMYNPTPYYMNISSLRVGSVFSENLTLSPDETQVVGKKPSSGTKAEVVFINDFGGDSGKITVPVI
jgi:fimbrial chaperone protein